MGWFDKPKPRAYVEALINDILINPERWEYNGVYTIHYRGDKSEDFTFRQMDAFGNLIQLTINGHTQYLNAVERRLYKKTCEVFHSDRAKTADEKAETDVLRWLQKKIAEAFGSMKEGKDGD